MVGFLRRLAQDLAPAGITVNAGAPPSTAVPRVLHIDGGAFMS